MLEDAGRGANKAVFGGLADAGHTEAGDAASAATEAELSKIFKTAIDMPFFSFACCESFFSYANISPVSSSLIVY